MATAYVKKEFNVEISIDRIQFNPFRSFILHRVLFSDHRSDTLFFAYQLDFKLKELNIRDIRFGLENVKLDGGYCKLITYEDSTSSLDVLDNFMSDDTTTTSSDPFHLYFENLLLTNSRFKLYDFTTPHDDSVGFDGLNEYFYNVYFDCKTFHIVDDSLYFDIHKIATKERSGFELNHLSARTVIYPKGIILDSLLIRTPHSEIGNRFSMTFDGWESMEDFENLVWMSADLQSSKVSFKDVAYFAPSIGDLAMNVQVSGNMRGPLSSMRVRNFSAIAGKSTNVQGVFSINGLPDVDNLFIDCKFSNLTTHAVDIENLIETSMPSQLHNMGAIQYQGTISGFINDFVSIGTISTDAGTLYSDLNLKMPEKADPSYSGRLRTSNLDVGKILSMEKMLGAVALDLKTDGEGFDFKTLSNRFELKIDSIFANGYQYTDIKLGGSLDKQLFEGGIEVNDPNFDLDFNGSIDFSREVPLYKFIADLNYIDLKLLNVDTADIAMSAKFDIDFAFANLDENEGRVDIDRVIFIKEGKDYPIRRVSLITSINDNNRSVKLVADGVEAGISGNVKIRELDKVFESFISYLFPAYFAKPADNPYNEANFVLYANVSDLSTYSTLFFPWFNMQNANTQFAYNGNIHSLKSKTDIGYIRINDLVASDFQLNTTEPKDNLKLLNLHLGALNMKDSSVVQNVDVRIAAEENQIHTSINIVDSVDNIFAKVQFESDVQDQSIFSYADQTDILFRGLKIAADREGKIIINKQQLQLEDFNLKLGSDQNIFLNGFTEFAGRNNIRADLSNVRLNIINIFYRKLGFDLDGSANGAFVLRTNKDNLNVNTFLNIDKLMLDSDTIGDFTLNSSFNDRQNRLTVYAKSLQGKLRSMEVGGYIGFGTSDNPIDFSVSFDESPLDVFQAFLKDNAKIFEGTVAIKSKVTGTVNKPIVNGKIQLDKVHARIEYLKTSYRFSTAIDFDDLSMSIPATTLVDERGSEAVFQGAITHTYFKNFNLNMKLNKLNKFMVLNTSATDNELFYGRAFATGSVSVTGPIDDLMLSGRLRTENNTIIYLPISSGSEITDAGFVHFVNKDTNAIKAIDTRMNTLSGFAMSLTIDVTPNAEFQMIIDPVNDDKITGNGAGIIKMELTKQGAFNMYGTIDIERGEYKLTAANFFTRRFIIDKGSKIAWTGDPLEAQMNIRAIYKVRKTSVANIVATATDEERRLLNTQRVPVNCILMLDGNLLRPSIQFDINFPQMEGVIGTNNVSTIENSLRTLRNNPDLMNEQVVSLLLFGQFVPLTGMQTANNQSNLTSGINNTVSDLISSQANNLIGRIVPGLDFNVDIQTGAPGQQAMYVFSASKKFFDDRLEVQGSYDPQFFNNNFLTQYSLTRTGNIRARVFSRNTTTVDGIYNRNTITQGIGLYYRKEFDNFNQLLKRKNQNNNIQ